MRATTGNGAEAAQRADRERGKEPDATSRRKRARRRRAHRARLWVARGADAGGNERRAKIEPREEAEGEGGGRAEAIRDADLIEARVLFVRRLRATAARKACRKAQQSSQPEIGQPEDQRAGTQFDAELSNRPPRPRRRMPDSRPDDRPRKWPATGPSVPSIARLGPEPRQQDWSAGGNADGTRPESQRQCFSHVHHGAPESRSRQSKVES